MDLNKHIEFFNPEKLKDKNIDVNIIGVGAVGSYIALQLAKLGIEKLIIWDFDVVDEHNITNQVYDYEDLNLPKVDALEKHLKRSNPEIKVIKKGKYSAGMPISGIVFLEVDSMKVRQEFVDDNTLNVNMINDSLFNCYNEMAVISLLKEKGINIRESVAKLALPVRWLIYYALILIIIIFGYTLGVQSFIYANF